MDVGQTLQLNSKTSICRSMCTERDDVPDLHIYHAGRFNMIGPAETGCAQVPEIYCGGRMRFIRDEEISVIEVDRWLPSSIPRAKSPGLLLALIMEKNRKGIKMTKCRASQLMVVPPRRAKENRVG